MRSINIEVTDDFMKRLEELSQEDGISTGQVLTKAFVLFDVSHKKVREGHKISVTNNQNEIIDEIVGI